MKVIDNNGRLFGKISLIDVLAVLVVLALGAALYVKSNQPHTGASVPTGIFPLSMGVYRLARRVSTWSSTVPLLWPPKLK